MNTETIQPDDLFEKWQAGTTIELIDVRTPAEFRECHVEFAHNVPLDQLDPEKMPDLACGHLPGAVNIPIDELRSHFDQLPRDRAIVVYCQVGQRGYLAARILQQNRFPLKELERRLQIIPNGNGAVLADCSQLPHSVGVCNRSQIAQ